MEESKNASVKRRKLFIRTIRTGKRGDERTGDRIGSPRHGGFRIDTERAAGNIQTWKIRRTEEKDKIKTIVDQVISIVKSIRPLNTLTEDEYLRLFEYDATSCFEVGMGAEAVLEVIKKIDLDKLAADLREEIQNTSGQRHIKATKRLAAGRRHAQSLC